ncbi:hypothetical protein NIES4071_29730 [Calothrix sp. NIES-4071]|nr:hypothetical protein NIES4071_29730 [Calothrix sp. NIES-4071]BAZ57293.1 hypothetical protein NIES4105_29670 [Calothrix sp. NIES-4105]
MAEENCRFKYLISYQDLRNQHIKSVGCVTPSSEFGHNYKTCSLHAQRGFVTIRKSCLYGAS